MSQLGGVAAGIWRVEARMLLHSLQCTGQPAPQDYPALKVSGAEVEKSCSMAGQLVKSFNLQGSVFSPGEGRS